MSCVCSDLHSVHIISSFVLEIITEPVAASTVRGQRIASAEVYGVHLRKSVKVIVSSIGEAVVTRTLGSFRRQSPLSLLWFC
jgi:hypothetical protein